MISLLMSLRKLTKPSKRTFILVFASVRGSGFGPVVGVAIFCFYRRVTERTEDDPRGLFTI